MKRLFAACLALSGLYLAACGVDVPAGEEDVGQESAMLSCDTLGLEWKPFLAHMAYDAAQDFGRWEFTTDLEKNWDGSKLQISQAGYAQCSARGRSGCPSMTAALTAQDGGTEVQVNGKVIMNPNTIRTQLTSGFDAQVINEANAQWIGDNSEVSPYNNFQSPTKTGLPHTLSNTNCAATIYTDNNFGGSSACLRVGNYTMGQLGISNDALSSIKVRSGMKVTIYGDDNYKGASASYTADAATVGMNDQTSSIVVSSTSGCSSYDTFKVNLTNGGDWTKIRAKLVTLGYMRGNDVLDVRIDLANQTIDVDPYNVDFVPPTSVTGSTDSLYGVSVKSSTAETWRSTDDPTNLLPLSGGCHKKPYGSTNWMLGIVKSSGSYRYCG